MKLAIETATELPLPAESKPRPTNSFPQPWALRFRTRNRRTTPYTPRPHEGSQPTYTIRAIMRQESLFC